MEVGGRKVVQVAVADGLKPILVGGSWVCYRLSRTDAAVRARSEARNQRDTEALRRAVEYFAFN